MRAIGIGLALLALTACGGDATNDGTGGSGASSGTGGGGGGGTSGSGGGTSGGSGGGTSGAPGGGGAPCAALAEVYLEQLDAARTCDPSIDGPQCTLQVADELPCPCAPTFVDASNTAAVSSLGEVAAQWQMQQCGGDPCPAIACQLPTSAVCEPDPGTGLGRCKDVYPDSP